MDCEHRDRQGHQGGNRKSVLVQRALLGGHLEHAMIRTIRYGAGLRWSGVNCGAMINIPYKDAKAESKLVLIYKVLTMYLTWKGIFGPIFGFYTNIPIISKVVKVECRRLHFIEG